MIQFSNDKIRKEWQGKKFVPSMVKGIKPIIKQFSKFTLVGDKNTSALMVKKEYTGSMKGKKPTELWVITAEDKSNKNREGILTTSDIADYLKNPTESFDKIIIANSYELYCVKGHDKGYRNKTEKLIEKNDFFEFSMMGYLCEPAEFTIFGKEADYEDFGVKEDIDDDPPDYECGNMKFTPFEDKAKIAACCKKYGIDENQFNEICKVLDEELSFGSCGLCN